MHWTWIKHVSRISPYPTSLSHCSKSRHCLSVRTWGKYKGDKATMTKEMTTTMRGGTGMRTSLLAAKWNFSREDAQGRRLKNFVQIRSVSSVDIAYLSQSWPELYWWRRVCYSGDIIAKKDPGFSFPYEANPEFDFDANAESERLAKLQNT